MSPSAFAREARRLVIALHPQPQIFQLKVSLESYLPEKSGSRTVARERWKATAYNAECEADIPEDAMAMVISKLESQVDKAISDRREALSRLEAVRRPSLRLVAKQDEPDSSGGTA